MARLLVMMAAATLILAACGDDDDGATQPADSVPTQSIMTEPASTSTSGASGGVPTITVAGRTGAVPGVSEECVALANGLLGVVQLLAQSDMNPNEVNAELTRAATGDLPGEVQDDLTTVLAAVAYPGGITEVSPEQLIVVNEALERVRDYADRECAPTR